MRAAIAVICGSLVVATCARDPFVPTFSPNHIATESCRQVTPASAPPVVWWASDKRDTQSESSRWCATVGPVVFHAQPGRTAGSDSHSEQSRIDRLAIVSWNLHVGGGDVDGLIGRLRAGEFTGGEPIGSFVLLLQEAYRRGDGIPTHLARHLPAPGRIAASHERGPGVDHFWGDDGLAVLYAPSMRNGIVDLDREDRGNLIVSTMPLDSATLFELPIEHQRRVAIATTVGATTSTGVPWRLRVVDVHLDTAIAWLHGGPFAARRRQADALVAGLQATAAAEATATTTTVVAGDFNTWGGREQALDVVERAFPNRGTSGTGPTWSGPLGIHATLDHVFADSRGQMTVSRLPERYGSDHYPLLAVIHF